MAYSKSRAPFDQTLSKSELNSWQASNLEMDERFAEIYGEAVHSVVSALQQEIPWRVEKVVLGGSLGKGTAIKGRADADCVVFLGNFSSMDDFRRKIKGMIDKLNHTHLKNIQEYKMGNLKDIDKTPFSSTFTLKVQGEEISVDLLPAYDNIEKKGANATYQEMSYLSDSDKKQYRSSFTGKQVDFMKSQPAAVKNLIRLVKHWKKTFLPTEAVTSFLLELITIKAWEEAGSPLSFDLRQGLKAVAQALVNYTSLNVSWPGGHGAYVHKKQGEPRVLDPGNPHNNVAASCNAWSEIARYAHQLLSCNLLQGVMVCRGWN